MEACSSRFKETDEDLLLLEIRSTRLGIRSIRMKKRPTGGAKWSTGDFLEIPVQSKGPDLGNGRPEPRNGRPVLVQGILQWSNGRPVSSTGQLDRV